MGVPDKVNDVKRAIELISRPTPKRLRAAADILLAVAYSDKKKYCEQLAFQVVKFKQVTNDGPIVKLKKFICAICPSCSSHTFDLNTEIMQGQCLSCSFKSSNYKADMLKRTN